jgi:hypothetical protein
MGKTVEEVKEMVAQKKKSSTIAIPWKIPVTCPREMMSLCPFSIQNLIVTKLIAIEITTKIKIIIITEKTFLSIFWLRKNKITPETNSETMNA